MSPLQRQLVELPWGQGLELKKDPYQIPLGKLLALSNAVFTSPGKLQKRNGYSALSPIGATPNPTALFARGNELLQIDGAAGSSLYSFSTSSSNWIAKGAMPSIGASITSSAQPQYSTYCIDMAVAPNGLQCFVYELVDTNAPAVRKGIGYTIVDPATGQVVVPPSILESSTTAGSPHVIVLGGNFVCYYIIGVLAASSALLGRALSIASLTGGWSASTTLTSGAGTSALALSPFNFDCVADSTAANGYIVLNNRSGSLTVFQVLSATPLVVTTQTTLAASGLTPTVFMDLNGNVILGIDGIPAKFAVLAPSVLTIVKALTNLTGNSGAAMTGVSTAAGAFTMFYSGNPSTTSQAIQSNSVGGVVYNAIAGSATAIVRSLGIAAKAFAINGLPYLPTWFCFNTSSGGLQRFNTPQNGIYLIDATGRVLSKALIGTNGGYETISLFNITSSPSYQLGATTVNGGTATFPASNTNVLEATVANSRFGETTPGVSPLLLNYNYGAAAVSMAFSDTANGYQRAQLANEVHTNGGVLQMYDGQQVVEHGFLVYPSFVNVSLGGGGALSAGSYQVCCTYEWMDGQGQVHRSTPSVPVSFTATAGQTATYSTATLSLTAKTGVVVQFYRTTVNGSVFFQVTNFNSVGSLYNNPAIDTVSWSDIQSDTAISGNPQLYTTGLVLSNEPCNPGGAMTVHRNRLFVVDSTNPTQVWYSKQVFPPVPVEFSGFNILNVDPKGGPITALASLDDKLIIFKADRIFMVLGQGPDPLGNQNDFTDAILVSADTGCVVPKSVVVVPDGIVYQSPKGIYLLSRALQVGFIGAPVATLVGPQIDGLVNWTVSSSVLMPDRHQVRFGIAPQSTEQPPFPILVYDYLVSQWTSVILYQTADQVIDATLVGGNYFALSASQVAAISDTSAYNSGVPPLVADFTTTATQVSIRQSLTTGWIKIGGLQGFQRARRLWLLGTYAGASHTLNIGVAYDYDSTIVQTSSFGVTADPAPYQFMVHLARQKCEAIQVTISETIAAGQPSNTADWSGLQLEIGIKKGGNKMPASGTAG